MKIVFVIPGTKIKLLEDTTTPLPSYYGPIGALKDYCPQKGDELQVSQVYIRKNGYFESSLTFKATAGPIMNVISRAKLAGDLEANKKSLLEEEAKLQKLNSLGENLEWHINRVSVNYDRNRQQIRKTEEFSGQDKKSSKDLKIQFFPVHSSGYSSFSYNNYNSPKHLPWESEVLVRCDINEEIKKLRKKVSNPPKVGKINATFRVKLKDIETWEVEIER